MNLTSKEIRFWTALAREHNQTGCRGPAHDLLRRHAYPDAPTTGPGSLAFAYAVVPLTSILLADCKGLDEIDQFLRQEDRIIDPEWPWSSADEYRARLDEARRQWPNINSDQGTGSTSKPPSPAGTASPPQVKV